MAGVGGIAVLLGCVYLGSMTLWLSVVVAAVVCAAIMLLAPGGALEVVRTKPTEAEQKAIDAVRQMIVEITESGRKVAGDSPRGARLLGQIAEKMTRIIDVIATDRNKFQAAEPFRKDMTPVCSFFPQYAKLVTRKVKAAEAAIKDAEERQLPRLIERLDSLYERLHSYDAAWLETENEFTLPNIGDVDFKIEGGQP